MNIFLIYNFIISWRTILYRFEDHGSWCIAVKWDSGSTLSLIEGVDRYTVIGEEKSNPTDGKDERNSSKHVP